MRRGLCPGQKIETEISMLVCRELSAESSGVFRFVRFCSVAEQSSLKVAIVKEVLLWENFFQNSLLLRPWLRSGDFSLEFHTTSEEYLEKKSAQSSGCQYVKYPIESYGLC